MHTLTSAISPTCSSLHHRPIFKSKFSFPNTPRVTLAPPKRMENEDSALRATSKDDVPPEPLVGRRDLLLMGAATVSAAAAVGAKDPPPAVGAGDYPIKLDGVVSRVVARPRKSRSREEKEGEEEVLVIDGIEFDRSLPVKFDVYVNDDDVGDSPRGGPDTAEFAGSMVNVPHGQGRGKSKIMKTCLRLGITDLLETVGADDDDAIIVTLVPKYGAGLVTIRNIGIELIA